MLLLAATFGIQDLDWLAGNWRSQQPDGVFEETWLKPTLDSMQGCGRLIAPDKTRFMEFMSIEKNSEGKWTLFMVLGAPSKSKQRTEPFLLISSKKNEVVFEREVVNDFPKSIRYELAKKDNLKCILTGQQSSKEVTETYDFKRLK